MAETSDLPNESLTDLEKFEEKVIRCLGFDKDAFVVLANTPMQCINLLNVVSEARGKEERLLALALLSQVDLHMMVRLLDIDDTENELKTSDRSLSSNVRKYIEWAIKFHNNEEEDRTARVLSHIKRIYERFVDLASSKRAIATLSRFSKKISKSSTALGVVVSELSQILTKRLKEMELEENAAATETKSSVEAKIPPSSSSSEPPTPVEGEDVRTDTGEKDTRKVKKKKKKDMEGSVEEAGHKDEIEMRSEQTEKANSFLDPFVVPKPETVFAPSTVITKKVKSVTFSSNSSKTRINADQQTVEKDPIKDQITTSNDLHQVASQQIEYTKLKFDHELKTFVKITATARKENFGYMVPYNGWGEKDFRLREKFEGEEENEVEAVPEYKFPSIPAKAWQAPRLIKNLPILQDLKSDERARVDSILPRIGVERPKAMGTWREVRSIPEKGPLLDLDTSFAHRLGSSVEIKRIFAEGWRYILGMETPGHTLLEYFRVMHTFMALNLLDAPDYTSLVVGPEGQFEGLYIILKTKSDIMLATYIQELLGALQNGLLRLEDLCAVLFYRDNGHTILAQCIQNDQQFVRVVEFVLKSLGTEMENGAIIMRPVLLSSDVDGEGNSYIHLLGSLKYENAKYFLEVVRHVVGEHNGIYERYLRRQGKDKLSVLEMLPPSNPLAKFVKAELDTCELEAKSNKYVTRFKLIDPTFTNGTEMEVLQALESFFKALGELYGDEKISQNEVFQLIHHSVDVKWKFSSLVFQMISYTGKFHVPSQQMKRREFMNQFIKHINNLHRIGALKTEDRLRIFTKGEKRVSPIRFASRLGIMVLLPLITALSGLSSSELKEDLCRSEPVLKSSPSSISPIHVGDGNAVFDAAFFLQANFRSFVLFTRRYFMNVTEYKSYLVEGLAQINTAAKHVTVFEKPLQELEKLVRIVSFVERQEIGGKGIQPRPAEEEDVAAFALANAVQNKEKFSVPKSSLKPFYQKIPILFDLISQYGLEEFANRHSDLLNCKGDKLQVFPSPDRHVQRLPSAGSTVSNSSNKQKSEKGIGRSQSPPPNLPTHDQTSTRGSDQLRGRFDPMAGGRSKSSESLSSHVSGGSNSNRPTSTSSRGASNPSPRASHRGRHRSNQHVESRPREEFNTDWSRSHRDQRGPTRDERPFRRQRSPSRDRDEGNRHLTRHDRDHRSSSRDRSFRGGSGDFRPSKRRRQ